MDRRTPSRRTGRGMTRRSPRVMIPPTLLALSAPTAQRTPRFHGEVPTGEQAAAWRAAHATFDRFNAADRYLFSVPMWNAGVPYILKQFIDVVSQPGLVFSFDPAHGYCRWP